MKPIILAVMAVLCLGQVPASAASKPLELKWVEAGTLMTGHDVDLDLSDGSKIGGEAVSLREDTVVMDIRRSSGPSAKKYSKGSAAVPKGDIKLITVKRTRGTWGRSLGTTLGVISGLALGGYTAAHTTENAGPAITVFTLITAGVSVAGYYSGKQLDIRRTRITIIP